MPNTKRGGLLVLAAMLVATSSASTQERVTGNMAAPVRIKSVPPVYPPIAQSAGVEGTVILEVTIGKTGKVENARVLRSIELLDQAALDAGRQWEYSPTILNGVPISVIMTVTVAFTLDRQSGSQPSERQLRTPEPAPAGSVRTAPGALIGNGMSNAPTGPRGLQAYARCGVGPNYTNEVTLQRWAGGPTGVQLAVSVNSLRVSALSPVAARRYTAGMNAGASLWPDKIPYFHFRIVHDDPAAEIQITLSDSTNEGDPKAEGDTVHIPGSAAGQPVIAGAKIGLRRNDTAVLLTSERLLANGRISELNFEAMIARTVAHEMGHALGIIRHSSSTRDLMSRSGNDSVVSDFEYQTWLSPADVNTMNETYDAECSSSSNCWFARIFQGSLAVPG
jgi:TonB family protein